MKVYHGFRTTNGVKVEVIQDVKNGSATHDISSLRVHALKHVVRHSPTGFEFGYSGSGPSDLARCILLDMGYPENEVEAHYQQFKWDFIARLEQDKDFYIYEDSVTYWWEGRHGRSDV